MGWCDAHRAEHNVCGHGKLNHPPHAHCEFDIWAPDRHSSINNLAFSAYAFHQQQIEETRSESYHQSQESNQRTVRLYLRLKIP